MVKQLIDLVIVEIFGVKVGAPIFVASCYLHHAQGIDCNLELLAEVSVAIDDFRAANPDGRVLVMGDFNMDPLQLVSHKSAPGLSALM